MMSTNIFSRRLTRWLVFACVLIGALWVLGVVSLDGYRPHLSHSLDGDDLDSAWSYEESSADADQGPVEPPPFTLPHMTPPSGHNDTPPAAKNPPPQLPPTKAKAPNKEKLDRPYPPPGPVTLWNSRAEKVKAAFVYAYDGYKKYAGDMDELLPTTGRGVNNFNGWHVTLVDALDTMWIMGLKEQFADSAKIVSTETFYLTETRYAPFFETVIRYLGGLLSAYALSKDSSLLNRADDLGQKMLPAFQPGTGLPRYAVNTVNGETRLGWPGAVVLFSEATSCQMEYKYLAHLTGKPEYYHKAEDIMESMRALKAADGLYYTKMSESTGRFSNRQISVGAFADSGYEYLLKQYLLTGQSDTQARDMYIQSANGILSRLLYLSPTRKLLYVTDTDGGKPSHTLEHLSCFLPGLLALGTTTLDLSEKDKQRHLWAAEGLAYTCWMTYEDQQSGLGPDEARFTPWKKLPSDGVVVEGYETGRWMEHLEKWESEGKKGKPPGLGKVKKASASEVRDYTVKKTRYLLRPETIESFYYMWRVSKDEVWRDRGWAVFQAIETHCRTTYGFASVDQIDSSTVRPIDEMPSYFMAETLKYLYLLFSDGDPYPFEEWVFNTEAHPLPVFQWDPAERDQFGIH